MEGKSLKGPTDDFCAYASIPANAQGIADAYCDVLDGVVADEPVRESRVSRSTRS